MMPAFRPALFRPGLATARRLPNPWDAAAILESTAGSDLDGHLSSLSTEFEDRVVEIGLVRLNPDGARQRLVERVDPGIDIPDQASKVHGIRTEEVRGLFGKPKLVKLAPRLIAFLGDADLAGFNSINYDLPMWTRECARHQIAFSLEGRRQIDAKLIFNVKETSWDRFLMGPRNLTAAVRHYCGRDLDGGVFTHDHTARVGARERGGLEEQRGAAE